MEENNKGKKGNKKLIIIIVLVVVLLLGALGGTYIFFKSTGRELPFKKEVVLEEKVIQLQQFVVNLKTTSSANSYLKVTVVLGYMEDDSAVIIEENEEKIRDRIIEILRTKSKAEFQDDNSTLVLKEDLKNSLNELLGEPIITAIYFNDFMIQ